MTPVEVHQGDGPIILGMPHPGTFIEDEVARHLNKTGLGITDTDWHVPRLYEGLLPGVTIVRATFHRYVIDANRDPSGASLYPGQNTTGLCPLTDFDGRPIYRAGVEPGPEEIERRRLKYHAPYHAALAAEIARVKARHGVAILYDCHSIRSRIPFLFDGLLPDFNIGTNNTTSCHPVIEAAVRDVCVRADGFTSIVNGRFRGGWTTRHYGHPKNGVHAIQMELAQLSYMREASPWDYLPDVAARTRSHLGAVLAALDALARSDRHAIAS
ncbi:N-formylglutamate deformylase [Bradyrhizobium sp. BR13661]|uniref:N-formylglutamate deformylase n=1 Tax=Bradyrhizobium sp. BR13661 TaxID=2940622 RepID=UPI0024731D44|nr:N-formylglutamate deformylase [Bradyrhizobium sp. BR13661]MDH6257510.1 N-formylglutamate deformylase [Bradyrhizobium sp. BR13661]